MEGSEVNAARDPVDREDGADPEADGHEEWFAHQVRAETIVGKHESEQEIRDDEITFRTFRIQCKLASAAVYIEGGKQNAILFLVGFHSVSPPLQTVSFLLDPDLGEDALPAVELDFRGQGARWGPVRDEEVVSVVITFRDQRQLKQYMENSWEPTILPDTEQTIVVREEKTDRTPLMPRFGRPFRPVPRFPLNCPKVLSFAGEKGEQGAIGTTEP